MMKEQLKKLSKEKPNDAEFGKALRELLDENYLDILKEEKEQREKKRELDAEEKKKQVIMRKAFMDCTEEDWYASGYDITIIEIAEAFWKLIASNLKGIDASTLNLERAKFKAWVHPVKMMILNDGIITEHLREVFKFLKGHEFWSANIQSTEKLRKQFATLHAQAKQQQRKDGKETTKEGRDELTERLHSKLSGTC